MAKVLMGADYTLGSKIKIFKNFRRRVMKTLSVGTLYIGLGLQKLFAVSWFLNDLYIGFGLQKLFAVSW